MENKKLISEFLKEKGISFYKVCQIMGEDPITATTKWQKRLIGEAGMDYKKFVSLCEKLEMYFKDNMDNTKVDPEDFIMTKKQVYLK